MAKQHQMHDIILNQSPSSIAKQKQTGIICEVSNIHLLHFFVTTEKYGSMALSLRAKMSVGFSQA